MRTWIGVAAVVAGLLLAACQSSGTATGTTADGDRVDWRPQPPRSPLVLDQRDRSPNVRSSLAPGSRIEFPHPPRADRGIPLPGGGALPALNGVTESGVVRRPDGALPPVTGLVVDDDGLEWYQHEDGSLTTSRWVWSNDRKRWEPVTAHAVAAR